MAHAVVALVTSKKCSWVELCSVAPRFSTVSGGNCNLQYMFYKGTKMSFNKTNVIRVME